MSDQSQGKPKDALTPKIRPGVKALIVHQGKILLIKERVEEGVIYDFPGGGMEYGEDIKETLHREVFEEVGLKIKIEKAVGNWSFVLQKYQVQIVCLGYQCRLVGEERIDTTHNPADEDIFDFLWLTNQEILARADALLKVKGMKEAVENVAV